MVAGSVMRATGDARMPGFIMTGGAVLNLALDPLLIFGWFGMPQLGLTGAARCDGGVAPRHDGAPVVRRGCRRPSVSARRALADNLFASWREILGDRPAGHGDAGDRPDLRRNHHAAARFARPGRRRGIWRRRPHRSGRGDAAVRVVGKHRPVRRPELGRQRTARSRARRHARRLPASARCGAQPPG